MSDKNSIYIIGMVIITQIIVVSFQVTNLGLFEQYMNALTTTEVVKIKLIKDNHKEVMDSINIIIDDLRKIND